MNRGIAATMSRLSLHVIDGTSVLFRAYHGSGRATDASGQEIGALEGFKRSLSGMRRRLRTTHGVVVFDTGGPTFRHRLEPSYKANRDAPPEELVRQLTLAPAAAEAAGFAVLDAPDFEADDVMATLARRSREATIECVLVTPDKDCLQLVRDDVVVLDPTSWNRCDAGAVRERLGVSPDRVIDFLALAGDPSDNVSGVPGIGPKTARILVSELGDIETILANPARAEALPIRGARRIAERLAEHADTARHCRELVRLRDDVPVPESFARLRSFRLRDPMSPWETVDSSR